MSNLNIVLAFIGVWLVIGSLIINVRAQLVSKLYFKVIPFFMGLFCLWYSLKMSGVI